MWVNKYVRSAHFGQLLFCGALANRAPVLADERVELGIFEGLDIPKLIRRDVAGGQQTVIDTVQQHRRGRMASNPHAALVCSVSPRG
jgi:hypothetical protein